MGRPVIDLTGQTFGKLTVTHRAETNGRTAARWHCTCTCGGTTVVVSYDLRSGNTKTCGCSRMDSLLAAWAASVKPDDQITYGGAHARVERTRGFASTYICVDCCAQAAHWSLRHDAPVTFSGQSGRGDGYACRFSANPDDYEPRCVPCHKAYDSQGAPA